MVKERDSTTLVKSIFMDLLQKSLKLLPTRSKVVSYNFQFDHIKPHHLYRGELKYSISRR